MITTHRTVAGLLAVIAVLLALNLIVKGGSVAWAQVAGPLPEPTLVTAQVLQSNAECTGGGDVSCAKATIYRFWSDGAADVQTVYWDDLPECGLDTPKNFPPCGPVLLIPGTCQADVDRNGNVTTSDLLEVLAGWGECE